ncbi:GTP-binding protein [Takifugu flavidus]|uniref:GTP-binding protein n=1 Tax=Takifugu flavidus TaxID=433684 RepID=A0A5C6P1B8_9TELE|nr:GTP-binding protein [Takifugu flavidus]
MPEQSNDYRVVVFGAGGVGKSSLVLRFVKGTFRDTYIPTVEDTYRQVISCDKSVCTLQITDTTGSHQFPAMQRLSISKGHAFILVYSITSKQSLEELKPIYQQVLAIKGNVDAIPIMLVGNKSDETHREVETKDGEAQANQWKCAFMETSAKTNHNVTELFQELLNLDKKRNMSLNIDGKRSGKQSRAERLKGKCSVIAAAGAARRTFAAGENGACMRRLLHHPSATESWPRSSSRPRAAADATDRSTS